MKIKQLTKLFLFFFLVGNICVCTAKAEENPLSISIKKSYLINEKITFKIKNKLNREYYYVISLEQKIGSRWLELIPDISRKNVDKSIARHCIYPKQEILLSFKKNEDTFKPKVGSYRIMINCWKKEKDRENMVLRNIGENYLEFQLVAPEKKK